MAQEPESFVLEFQSQAFEVSAEGDDYYNDCCRGADGVCAWLIAELRKRGLKTLDVPDQEDWGWYFECGVGDEKDHMVGVSYLGDEDDAHCWQVQLRKNAGFFKALFGRRPKTISPEIAAALRETLEKSDRIFGLH